MSNPSACLILKLKGMALIGGQHLREGDAYFKVSVIIHLNFENFQITE